MSSQQIRSRPGQLCPSLPQGSLLEQKIPSILFSFSSSVTKEIDRSFFLDYSERPHEHTRGQRPDTCSLPPSSPTSLRPWILPEHATGSLGFATWPCPNPFLTSSLPMSHDDMENWASGNLSYAICPWSVPGDPGH